MKKNDEYIGLPQKLNILLADDDKDDCLIFKEALEELTLTAALTTVNDGEQLMQYLQTVTTNLPHALFLDLNMPRKNGFDWLTEIKNNSLLNKIPVIIYSTSYDEQKAHQLYNSGAHYYICKPPGFEELKNVVHKAIMLVNQNGEKASRENFLINKLKAVF